MKCEEVQDGTLQHHQFKEQGQHCSIAVVHTGQGNVTSIRRRTVPDQCLPVNEDAERA
jgi:hypothetical protein